MPPLTVAGPLIPPLCGGPTSNHASILKGLGDRTMKFTRIALAAAACCGVVATGAQAQGLRQPGSVQPVALTYDYYAQDAAAPRPAILPQLIPAISHSLATPIRKTAKTTATTRKAAAKVERVARAVALVNLGDCSQHLETVGPYKATSPVVVLRTPVIRFPTTMVRSHSTIEPTR